MAESTGKAQADEHDSGASIMGRGGQHGDTAALDKLMRTVESWSARRQPMTASEMESEDERGQDSDEDDAEVNEGSRAGGAPAVVVPADGRQMIWKDLWGADMGVVMREYFFKVDPDGSKFGHLPKMALASKGMMGALMAASFCERVNSCANLVVTEGNSLLSADEIDMLVVLRMNKVFMGFMRQNYPEVIESVHAKYGSVIRVEDCVEEEHEDDQPASIDME